MKKICIFLLAILFVVSTSGCSINSQKTNMVQSKRRFASYVDTQNNDDKTRGSVIDLSEGPKLNYDRKLGPQSLNFDIKIVDPY